MVAKQVTIRFVGAPLRLMEVLPVTSAISEPLRSAAKPFICQFRDSAVVLVAVPCMNILSAPLI